MTTPGSRVEPAALKSIRVKLSRANRQFQSLERSIDAYWERDPIQVEGEFNPNFTQHVSRLSIGENPPVDWSVRLGEAIYNIRTALDHTVHQLTIDNTGHHVDTSAFPIFSDPRKFQAEGLLLIRDVSRDARGMIQSMQPYQASNPRATALWYVNQAWNEDKHRHIRLMPAISDEFYTLTIEPPDVTAKVTVIDGLKEDGAVLANVDLAKPAPDTTVTLEPALHIADEFSWQLDPDIKAAHRRVVAEVTDIVDRLLSLIG